MLNNQVHFKPGGSLDSGVWNSAESGPIEDVHEKTNFRYHYDTMIANIENYRYNRLLDVGKI